MSNRNKKALKKLSEEIKNLEAQVEPDVWNEIRKETLNINKKGFTLIRKKFDAEPDYEAMAKRIREKAEEKVSDRRKYISYGIMKSDELLKEFCSNRKLRNKFDSKFRWFVSFIRETFPDSPINNTIEFGYLRSITEEQIDRMIRDTSQEKVGHLPNK